MHKIISLLFHPFSFLLLGVFFLFNTHTYINFSYSDELKLLVYGVLFTNTMLLPLIFAYYLKSKGHISSINMDLVSDRKLVYFFTFILFLATLFLLSAFLVPGDIYKYVFGSTLTIGSLFVLALFRVKLSAHLAGIGGLIGALVMLSMKLHTDFIPIITVLILLSGIIAMSRITLKAHNENEVYLGFLLGFFCQVAIYA